MTRITHKLQMISALSQKTGRLICPTQKTLRTSDVM
jgi:hypothetical protein